MGLILKFLGPVGIAGLVLSLALGGLLLIQKGETRHWHKQSDRYEQLYHHEQSAFAQTVANYRAAAEQARQADAANKARVEAEQTAINKEREASYEARIADARARAERLRHELEAAAHPGSSGAAPVPAVPGAAGGPDGPAPQGGLPPSDALTATEQAIQLDELQRWVRSQTAIPVNSPPPSPTGNP